MDDSAHTLMLRIFRDLPDPRVAGKVVHKLHDILVITVCAVISGLEYWTQIEDFAKANEQWFKSFLDLSHGIPSHDTFGKVFSVIDPDEFEKRIQRWIHALVGSDSVGKHIAIGGKTLRKSFDAASGKAAIHMINAYVYENHAVFGQLKVDSKTNEITAIPQLLEMLQLKEATVTIDAMGCQREIAQKIVKKEGHYVFALKGNQSALMEDVKVFMDDVIAQGNPGAYDYYESDVVLTGKSKKHSAYMIRGVCAAFMDLAYGGEYDPTGKTGLGTFKCEQVKGIESGDDYGEFVVTRNED